MNQSAQREPEGDFEEIVRGFYEHERASIEVPLGRLMARAAEAYPQTVHTPVPAPLREGWLGWFSRWWWQYSAGAAAIAACVFFLLRPEVVPVVPDAGTHDGNPAHPSWLQKRGAKEPLPLLQVAVKRGDKVLSLQSGDRVRQGDGLRIIVAWKKAGYVFLLHRDAKGVWVPVYPTSTKTRGVLLSSKARMALPGSIEVTDAPQGNEAFWACFSNEEIDYKRLVSSIEALPPRATQAPASCRFLQRFVLSRPKEGPQ